MSTPFLKGGNKLLPEYTSFITLRRVPVALGEALVQQELSPEPVVILF